VAVDIKCCISYFSYDAYSGGPLLDSKGSLIGINTAIFTQTGKLFYHHNQKELDHVTEH